LILRDCILAVDIGGTKVLAGILSRDGRILVSRKEPVCAIGCPEEVLKQIFRMFQQMMNTIGINSQNILGTGVGVPGPLDYVRGVVENSPNLRWLSYPIRDELSKRLGTKLLLDKDTNVAALGEKKYGMSRNCSHFIYITISTGIGGGIVADGKILHGQIGGASELGHMLVAPGGRRCACGRVGCLEAHASGTALSLDAKELIARGKGQNILTFCARGQAPTAYELGLAARQGDAEAIALINRAADYAAIGVANLVNIFNPERIVIGGGVGIGLQDFMLPRIREYVFANVFPLHKRNLAIEATQLGEDIVLLGCASMVLHDQLEE